jgi:hypothetical protein
MGQGHPLLVEKGERSNKKRERLSANLDPSVNLPSWCKAEGAGERPLTST